jgi:signal peptidase I
MHDSLEDIQSSLGNESRSKPTLRFIAALLSMLVPGVGQLLLKDKKRAVIFFAGFILLLFLYWPIRLPLHYGGLILMVFYAIGLSIASSYFALTANLQKTLPLSPWWLSLIVPMSLVFTLGLDANILLRAAGFRVFNIPSSSMAPTLLEGDTIVADMRHFDREPPKDGDIVIFRHNNLYLIKRVVAIGSEQISSQDGHINVNGVRPDEPYAHHEGNATKEMNDFTAVSVPAKQLFVMGDNRDLSLDSRMEEFGKVFSTDVAGIPLYILNSTSDRSGRVVR